jgi:galactose-1-phosphate uridylyltransferase
MHGGKLAFASQRISSRFTEPGGNRVEKPIEIRTHPISGRTCRIAYSRVDERDGGNEALPPPPPDRCDRAACPFCSPQVAVKTPRLPDHLAPEGRMRLGNSLLFPNLYPYGSYSAVSLFDDEHFVEIGTASPFSYGDSFLNCRNYLERVLMHDPSAVHLAITQNHLPSAGGSLLHPHLQVNADRVATNHHRFMRQKTDLFYRDCGRLLLSVYLEREKTAVSRYIGQSGAWEWLAAFAPEGFFEIWGILPGVCSLLAVEPSQWKDLAIGILNVQKFYRSLGRNGYNLGLLAIEAPASRLELRLIAMVRANYAPWVRNDHTGFEVMLGDMTTFVAPEKTAAEARPYFAFRGYCR